MVGEIYKLKTASGPLLIIMEGHYYHEGCSGLEPAAIANAVMLQVKPSITERCKKCSKSVRHWLLRRKT